MSPERAEQRQALERHVDEDRAAIGQTLMRLGQPVLTIERWQRRVQGLWPLLPGLLMGLLALGVTVIVMRAQRSAESRRPPLPGAIGAQALQLPVRRSWSAALQALINAWRLALQLQALMRASALAIAPMRPLARETASADPLRPEART